MSQDARTNVGRVRNPDIGPFKQTYQNRHSVRERESSCHLSLAAPTSQRPLFQWLAVHIAFGTPWMMNAHIHAVQTVQHEQKSTRQVIDNTVAYRFLLRFWYVCLI